MWIKVTSELMFELYQVPSLGYCVDGIMSFYQNHLPSSGANFSTNGLVLSFNTASTSVIPILRGRGLLSRATRYVIDSVEQSGHANMLMHPQDTMGRIALL